MVGIISFEGLKKVIKRWGPVSERNIATGMELLETFDSMPSGNTGGQPTSPVIDPSRLPTVDSKRKVVEP